MNPEEDNHKYATAATLITMCSSCVLMIFNGQVSQRMDPPLFMSLYALFNLYIWFIAYLYAPSLDFSSSVAAGTNSSKSATNVSDKEKERQKIMSEFYLSELSKDDIDEEETAGLKSGVIKKSNKSKN